MTTSRLGDKASYILGRVAALASRPLILLASNHLAGNDTAGLIAVAFLVVTLASAGSGFDSHRNFYRARFTAGPRQPVRGLYRDYVSALGLQILVLALPLLGYMLWRHQQPVLAVAVVLYFASERLADESQRFLIFKGARGEWGMRILVKACVQVLGVAAACGWAPHALAAAGAVGALLAGNLVAYAGLLHWKHRPRHWRLVFGAWRQCHAQSAFWLLSLATTVIAYLDRIVVLAFQQSDIAMYTLLVACLSVVQNAMEYFFVSLRRKEFLQSRIHLPAVFRDKDLYLIIGGGTALGAALCWTTVYFYRGQSIAQWWLIPVVLVSQITLSLTLVIREMLYWKNDVRWLIRLELGFILAALLLTGGLHLAGTGYVAVLAGLSLLYVGRLLLMARSAGTTAPT